MNKSPEEQFIREVCIKANPSIEDLVFERIDVMFAMRHAEPVFQWLSVTQTVSEAIERKNIENRYLYKLENKIHDIQKETREGRPIRLADVLLAIKEKYGDFVLEFSGIETCSLEAARIVRKWDLKNDDLSQQSVETISFIANLLKSE